MKGMVKTKSFASYNWLELLAAHDLRGALIRFVPIQIILLLLKIAQEYTLYNELDTAWHLMITEVFLVSVPFVAFALWLLARLDTVQKELIVLATRDALTGLPNRRSFFDQVQAQLPVPGGVIMMIDVDHFKRINDIYGHAVGDLCLKAISDQILGAFRNVDIVARIGGEEFAAMLIGMSKVDAELLGSRLSRGFDFALPDGAGTHRVTVSIGAVQSVGFESVETHLKVADEALYRAKESGRARLIIADGLSEGGLLAG